MRINLPAHILLLLALVFTVTAPPVSDVADYVPEQMICKADLVFYIDTINIAYGTNVVGFLPSIGAYLLQTQPGQDADSLSQIIGQEPYVVYCDPNFMRNAPEPVQGSQPFTDFSGAGDV